MRKGILETYGSLMALPTYAAPLSLCEGGTPLILRYRVLRTCSAAALNCL